MNLGGGSGGRGSQGGGRGGTTSQPATPVEERRGLLYDLGGAGHASLPIPAPPLQPVQVGFKQPNQLTDQARGVKLIPAADRRRAASLAKCWRHSGPGDAGGDLTRLVRDCIVGVQLELSQSVGGTPGRTMRDYDDTFQAMKKENFNLKLRIFFLEVSRYRLSPPGLMSPQERLGLGSAARRAGQEELAAANLDLKVGSSCSAARRNLKLL